MKRIIKLQSVANTAAVTQAATVAATIARSAGKVEPTIIILFPRMRAKP